MSQINYIFFIVFYTKALITELLICLLDYFR